MATVCAIQVGGAGGGDLPVVMDDVVMWSRVVLVLAVIPWLSYVIVLAFYALSILYGSV